MAERILTAPEIDHLLSFFRTGRGAGVAGSEVESLDLNRPSRVPRGAVESLHVRYEQAAQAVKASLALALRTGVEVVLESFEQRRFDDWRQELPRPCCGYVVDMVPLKQPAIVVVDHRLAFASIDRLLGGDGADEGRARELTSTEEAVFAEVLQEIVRAHANAWAPYAALRPGGRRPVSSPSYFRDLKDDEPLLIATLRVEEIAAGSRIRLVMPLCDLEPHLQHAPRVELGEKEAGAGRALLVQQLHDVEVELKVLIGSTEITVQDLVALEAGDVVLLDRPIEDGLALLVEGIAKFEGQLMRRGRHMVFRVGEAPGRGASGRAKEGAAVG